MIWLASYLIAGVIIFFGLRMAFKKAKIDPRPHDAIWTSWLSAPEVWLFTILFWPVLAASSVCWFAAEFFHASGKNEILRAKAIEAARDKTYDHLSLEQKIDLLEAEAKKRK